MTRVPAARSRTRCAASGSCTWPASMKWAAVSPSVVAAAVVLHPDRHIAGVCDSKLVPAAGASGSTIGSCGTPSPGRWRPPISGNRSHQHSPGVAARDAARDPLAGAPAGRRARRRVPRARDSDGAARCLHGDRRLGDCCRVDRHRRSRAIRQMLELHGRDPRYGFDRHKGYATADHLEAVARFGYSEVHRRSFRPPTLFDTID